jgi:probable rRNA maturation factor
MSVEVLNESGVDLDVTQFVRLARFTLRRMRVHPEAELCLKLVDEPTMTEFNSKYMGNEGPTDVLSFPMEELRPGQHGELDADGILGDMLLCPQYASGQAASFSRTADEEMHLLTIHGILHLLGYDHAEPEEEREMFSLQERLLAEWQAVKSGDDVE